MTRPRAPLRPLVPVALAAALLASAALAQPVPGVPGGPGVAASLPGQAVTVRSLFDDPAAPPVLIAAHRANSGRVLPRLLDWTFNRKSGPASRAENSLAAIDAAIAAGAHIVEIDVRHTRDGVLVLMHDDDLKRTTDRRGKVEDLAWAEVQQARLLPTGRIPTLEEALRHARGRVVFDLDLKTDRIDAVVSAIQAADARESVLVFESNRAHLLRVKQLDPAIEVMPRARDQAEALALIADPVLRPKVVHLDGPKDLAPPLLQAARDAGVRLWVNALGPKDMLGLRGFYANLIRKGAGVIQTDRPACVASAAR